MDGLGLQHLNELGCFVLLVIQPPDALQVRGWTLGSYRCECKSGLPLQAARP